MNTLSEISVRLTRDSVCAGDDGDAPHERMTKVPSFSDPTEFVRILASGYLPSVDGVGHRWICALNGIEIAVVAASGVTALVEAITFADNNEAHFTYLSAPY